MLVKTNQTLPIVVRIGNNYPNSVVTRALLNFSRESDNRDE